MSELRHALVLVVAVTICTGVVYPCAVTAIAAVAMPQQAKGSPLVVADTVRGSALVGLKTPAGPYFATRPSATVGTHAAATNHGQANPTWRSDVSARVRAAIADGAVCPVPVDLVTASGSGVDPHISPEAARAQIPRVAKAAGVEATVLEAMVKDATEEPLWGLIGQRRVNVLRLNLAVAGLTQEEPSL